MLASRGRVASKSDNKFGTFGGVFTPSILTILGVIMYLRLPWIVGHSGMFQALGIVAAAHIVSVCTGLSISSIATDKSVGAGGPYYIISRSLGLPIGGTLGLPLFLGLSFSISLYVIGFSESFLAIIDVPVTPNALRVCGTVTAILLTIITFISTSLAIKTQYIILGLIALSLVAIFFGDPGQLSPEGLTNPADNADMALLFGTFFPAVTGFTAGVNMSGDLRDPKSAIPMGTMAAIIVGLVVYVALALFLAIRVPSEHLIRNPRVLEQLSLWGPAVTAGIWGATLSSALGSILGAPRILQTVAADGIAPRWFAKGYGKTNEPRNALLLAFVIGEAGILIAELNMIARVVSIVFMTIYGFLNVAAAIEAWVSPDFRPDFRIPKYVSVTGAVTCLLLMINMDMPAFAGATVLMAVLYVALQRRQLALESGDAWEGIWSSLVRAGLFRLATADRQHRNWRPNILMFRPDDGEDHEALRRTAASLITGNGLLTDIKLREMGARPTEMDTLDEGPVVGVFERSVEASDAYATIESLAQYHGFAGLEPNTTLIDWDGYVHDAEKFGPLIDRLRARDLNVLLFSDATHEPPPGTEPRVDVWWRSGSSPALGISLVRFVTESAAYRNARVRFLTVTRDASMSDGLRNAARRMLEDARVSAELEIILDTVEPRPVTQHVSERSADAKLAIVELPAPPLAEAMEGLAAVTAAVPSVLFTAPSSSFQEVGRVLQAHDDEDFAERTEPLELEDLELPESEVLAEAAESFRQRIEGAVLELHESSLARVAARNAALLDRVADTVDRHFGQLEDGLGGGNPTKRRRLVNRVQSSLLLDYGRIIDEFVQQDLADERDLLEGRLRALADDMSLVDVSGAREVERDAVDFAAAAGDSRELTKHKAKVLRTEKGGVCRYDVDVGQLERWYVDKELVELVDDTVREHVTGWWNLAIQLMKLFHGSRASLTLIHGGPEAAGEAAEEFIKSEREVARERIENLKQVTLARTEILHAQLAEGARDLVQDFTDDLGRVDYPLFVAARRKPVREREALRTGLVENADTFYEQQKALFERAKTGLQVSSFQHRLATIVQRTREKIALELKNGALSGCRETEKVLAAFLEREADDESPWKVSVDLSHRFDPQQVVDSLVRDGQRSSEDLPDTLPTLSDESIQRLSEGEFDEVEVVDLPLRRLAQFLVDSELVGPLTAQLAAVPTLEDRAVGVAEDVIRLIGFHQNEHDPEAEESFLEHMRPVVENGLERLRAEKTPLEALVPQVDEALQRKLERVMRGTDVYELTSSAQALGQHIRRHQGQRAVSGAQSLALRGVERVRSAAVSAIYGRSAGEIMARRLRDQGDSGGALVDRVSRFVEENSPSASVLEDMPFYYRQLFFGKATLNETFWVEREAELAAARRGISQHGRGARGVLVVTGERDSGKTALCRRLTSRGALSGRPLFWVAPPDASSADPDRFRKALAETTGKRGRATNIVAALPDRSVVVIEDLELWWQRTEGGLAVIDLLLKLIETHAGRVLFVIEIGHHPLELLNRFRPLLDHALSVVECGPLPAESIKEIVMLRHGSTGMSFTLDGVHQDDLSDWREARLFTGHFSASRGLVGQALVSWITNVERADSVSIDIVPPKRRDWEVLDRLRAEWIALLVQLLLHKRIDAPSLARVSGLDRRELEHHLDVLTRMGLVRRSQAGVLRLNRLITHALVERLRERRVIA